MNPTPPETPGSEPADLSQLAATDALLDRLGARQGTDDDLTDPAVAALVEMLALIDEYREPDLGLSQLVEVLDGRPLYIAAADETVEALRVERPGLEALDSPRPSAEPRLIDLTDHGPADHGVLVEAGAGPAAGEPDNVAAFVPRQGSHRWQRALSQVSLPAASVVLLLALGSGVSAAVTGDPMTAMNGVSRVVNQLPGVSNPKRSLTQVQGEINAASTAVRQHDGQSANRHLQAARRGLSDVPDSSKPQLSIMINNVQTQLAATQPVPPAVQPSAPAAVVAPTTAPVAAKPTPTVDPTGTTPPVPPTEVPTTQPAPTGSVTAAPVGPTLAPVEPSPVVTTAGS